MVSSNSTQGKEGGGGKLQQEIIRLSYGKPGDRIKKQRHHFADKGPHSPRYGFSSSHVEMWELDHKEGWVPKNWCFWIVVLEKTLQSPLDGKEIKPIYSKENQSWIFNGKAWCWSWNSNTLATWYEEPTHRKRPWCWQRLRVEEGGSRGWDGWMASSTQCTWVWANSGRQWRTEEPGTLPSTGLPRVRHDWVNEHDKYIIELSSTVFFFRNYT